MERPVTPEERAILNGLAQQAEQLRGLTLSREVQAEVHSAEAIGAHMVEAAEEEELAEALAVYSTLGLIPEETDLGALLEEVLSEQVVGYYDTEAGKMVVREDIMSALLSSRDGRVSPKAHEAEVVLVHEFVHAIQDQRLELGERHAEERDDDPGLALRALIEGDATLVMMGHAANAPIQTIVAATPPERLDALVDFMAQHSSEEDNALARAPTILRETLIGPYVSGLRFCLALFRRGGWEAVNRAYDALPASTEQVLHPEKYFAGELPDPIALPDFPMLENSGWSVFYEDSFGELELSVYLGRTTPSEVDRPAGRGWSGDRIRVYEKDGEHIALWFTTWDNEAEAVEAVAAAQRSPETFVHRNGRAVLFAEQLPPAFQGEAKEKLDALSANLLPHPPRRPSVVAP